MRDNHLSQFEEIAALQNLSSLRIVHKHLLSFPCNKFVSQHHLGISSHDMDLQRWKLSALLSFNYHNRITGGCWFSCGHDLCQVRGEFFRERYDQFAQQMIVQQIPYWLKTLREQLRGSDFFIIVILRGSIVPIRNDSKGRSKYTPFEILDTETYLKKNTSYRKVVKTIRKLLLLKIFSLSTLNAIWWGGKLTTHLKLICTRGLW